MRTLLLSAVLAASACTQVGEIRPDGETPPLGPQPEARTYDMEDTCIQQPRPAVDILFVVDNSCSMDAEQQRLATNFPTFTNYFQLSGIDYHIGVVSTDMASPLGRGLLQRAQGHRWIDRDTPNPSAVFSDMALLGTGGSSDESGRSAAYTAVELNADHVRNEGFIRDEAELHMVFISDEDDASTNNPVTRSEFRQWMRTLKQDRDMVRSHALVWPNGESCPDGWSSGANYEQYAAWTGGVVGNICNADWTPFLDELGLATAGLKTEFFLTQLPQLDPWSLEVKVITIRDDQEITLRFDTCFAGDGCDVEYIGHRNSVVFTDFVPGPLDEVVIDYTQR